MKNTHHYAAFFASRPGTFRAAIDCRRRLDSRVDNEFPGRPCLISVGVAPEYVPESEPATFLHLPPAEYHSHIVTDLDPDEMRHAHERGGHGKIAYFPRDRERYADQTDDAYRDHITGYAIRNSVEAEAAAVALGQSTPHRWWALVGSDGSPAEGDTDTPAPRSALSLLVEALGLDYRDVLTAEHLADRPVAVRMFPGLSFAERRERILREMAQMGQVSPTGLASARSGK